MHRTCVPVGEAAHSARVRHAAFSREFILLLCLGLPAALLLQGCADCDPAKPSLDWEADLDEMDRLAGCKQEWDLVWGNPCASDLPVLLAKKGFVEQTDGDFRRGEVENEQYTCTHRGQGGYCTRWTAYEKGCDEEDFGICTCHTPHSSGRYCQKWRCIAKEANQHLCWRDCCGDSCDTPCVECGTHGSDPFPMNEAVFGDLLSADGMSFILSMQPGNDTGDAALSSLRSAHWGQLSYAGNCIVPRDIRNVYETTCRTWREIETEISDCECIREHPTLLFCQQWRCEEKDVGMFSILFAKSMSYKGVLEGMEEEIYDCLDSVNADGVQRCIRWKGVISSYEEVEMALCRVVCPFGQVWCDTWQCNEYELPRVLDEDEWGKRFGFCILHSLWLLLPVFASAIFPWHELPYPAWLVWSLEPFFFLSAILIAWSIGFVRYVGSEGRWIRPLLPLAGMLLTLFVPYVVGMLIGCFAKEPETKIFFVLSVTVPTFLLASGLWTTGIVGVAVLFSIFVLPCAVGTCLSVLAERRRSSG